MRIIAGELEILEPKRVDVLHPGIELHLRQRPGFTGQLEFGLLDVLA